MTLIEVLVAVGILVFGMAAIIAIVATAQRTHQRATHEINAVQVANSVLAELRASMSKGLRPDGTPPNATPETLPRYPGYPDYRYAIRLVKLEPKPVRGAAQPFGEEYFVEVKVYWAQGGENQSATFPTVMLLRGG